MSLVINHNLMAMTAARNLGAVYNQLSTSTQRLFSGLRVNSAADDAAGLAIRELMRSDIKVLNQGIRNASDAISMIQTAEGAMSVIDEKLIRMKELAEQAATGTYTTAQREIMNSEYQAMASEIDRIANATDFNGVKLLDGSLAYSHEGSGMKIHFGVGNDAAEDYYFVNMGDMRATLQTGLRVGNSDTLRTVMLNADTATAALSDSASAVDGLFGLRYSTDFDIEAVGSATWETYGYIDVDASLDSVSSLVQRINEGKQANGTLAFGGTFTSANIAGQSLTINGNVFTFTTAGTDSYDATNKTGVISLGTVAGSSVAWEVAGYLNTNSDDIGVRAAVNGTTMTLFAVKGGDSGNLINTVSATTVITSGQTNLSGGKSGIMTASVYFDAENSEYELQIQMNGQGEKNQLQIFGMSLTTASDSYPQIVGGLINGTSMNSTTAGYYGRLPISDTALATDYGSMDEVSEWKQAANGSGRTEWDGADILTQSGAQKALAAMDTAIGKKDTARASLGAVQNRLQNTITNLQIQAENLQAAESRISDVDVATEMTTFTKNNILAQAAVAMLAQANSLPQLALQLLGR